MSKSIGRGEFISGFGGLLGVKSVFEGSLKAFLLFDSCGRIISSLIGFLSKFSYLSAKFHGMRNAYLLLLLTFCLLAPSCRKSPEQEAFRELDYAIEHRGEYLSRFERENDSLRLRLPADGWEGARKLYEAYLHFSADSAERYVSLMEALAGNPREAMRSSITQCYLLGTAHYEESALSLLRAIDTTGMHRMGLTGEYLSAGIKIFTNLSRFSHLLNTDKAYSDSLSTYRDAFIAQDTVSYEGRKLLAQRYRDAGEYRRALEIFQKCFQNTRDDDYHQLTSIAYNMAILYGRLGDPEARKTWLAKSAVYDFKAPNRDFLSLYELSMDLYRQKDYERAGRYINIHFENVYAGDFQAHVIRSSGAQNVIVEAYLSAERQKRAVLAIAISVLAVLAFLVLWLLIIRHSQAIKLSRANTALEEANAALSGANKIKDNYVFRYMDLSVQYLDKIEETRHHLRQVARNQGTEALLKELRGAADYADYREFYRIFDQTFLGIFPNFVDGVNALLREDARFCVPKAGPLPTEIRILAAIRLGMDDSPRIASFLKCSLSTVYTYRAKMRNQALCPKEEFENMVKALS